MRRTVLMIVSLMLVLLKGEDLQSWTHSPAECTALKHSYCAKTSQLYNEA